MVPEDHQGGTLQVSAPLLVSTPATRVLPIPTGEEVLPTAPYHILESAPVQFSVGLPPPPAPETPPEG